MSQGNYREEFPDYTESLGVELPAGWRDVSWHNNAAPSFRCGRWELYVDYADPAMRELPGFGRYVLMELDAVDGAPVEDEASTFTEDAAVAQRWIDAITACDELLLEQLRCLGDGHRVLEAVGMIDDLQARVGGAFTADVCARLRALLPAMTREQRSRYVALSDDRETLLADYEAAEQVLQDVRGTAREADAQGAFRRADNALSGWLSSDEGEEWNALDQLGQLERGQRGVTQ